jgi:hypothetical protein
MLCKDSVLLREAANAAETPSASFLQRISLTAKDLEEEVEFFTSGLGFRLRQVRNLLAITLPRYRKLLCASALAPALTRKKLDSLPIHGQTKQTPPMPRVQCATAINSPHPHR